MKYVVEAAEHLETQDMPDGPIHFTDPEDESRTICGTDNPRRTPTQAATSCVRCQRKLEEQRLEEERLLGSGDTTRLDDDLLVDCDQEDGPCLAKRDPQTLEEFKAAYEHWAEHGLLAGCSHAR
jgi:hypothetical protein